MFLDATAAPRVDVLFSFAHRQRRRPLTPRVPLLRHFAAAAVDACRAAG